MEDSRKNLSARWLAAKRALFDNVYGSLNDCQRQAVFTTEGPLLVLAGAGSGKTTVLVRRIAHIIRYGKAYLSDETPDGLDEGTVSELERTAALPAEEAEPRLAAFAKDPCPPWRVLAITFTNKAAEQIRQRLDAELGKAGIPSEEIWSGTFHAICVRILRAHAERVGYGRNFTIYDADDTKRAVREAMRALDIDERAIPTRSVTSEISRAKDRLLSAADYEEEAEGDFRRALVAKAYRLYEGKLRDSNAMDFDDLILQTVRLLRENPDVAERYADRFRYVCVDEFQDTNFAQFELASLLSAKWRNLMVVGDDDQSIYRFRGASIRNILDFDRIYRDADVVRLERNYRSTSVILQAANEVIAHNDERRGKRLWTGRKGGDRIVLFRCEDQATEARVIAQTIRSLTQEGDRRYAYRDIAVLYRINAQSNAIERALSSLSVPYRVLCGTRFSDRKEIRDAVAYLQLAENPDDRDRLLRIVNEPRRKIGKRTLDVLDAFAKAHGCTLFGAMERADECPELSRSVSTLLGFTSMIRRLSGLARALPLPDLFDAMLDETGYLQMLLMGGDRELDRLSNLREFKSDLVEYMEKDGEATLGGFLEQYALTADADRYDETADAVTLMTVHSAKGLEFPVVMLPGMEDGIFPGMQNMAGDNEDMEEERRLAYVALTRAKDRLYLLYAQNRLLYGRTSNNPVSRFVREIPESLIEVRERSWSDRTETPRGAGRPVPPKRTDRTTVGRPVTGEPASRAAIPAEGDRVRHESFGDGEVLSVTRVGADWIVEVMFDRVGTKKLLGRYARLRKLDGGS